MGHSLISDFELRTIDKILKITIMTPLWKMVYLLKESTVKKGKLKILSKKRKNGLLIV
jgi:hypothetical protein